MSSEDPTTFDELIHLEATNREAVEEPPGCRGTGPAAFLATARWLHAAFADLRWEVHTVLQDGETVVIHTTMSGKQTGPFIEHWANRDDRGMGEQLGWTPPTPLFLARTLLATRRAKAHHLTAAG
ncbi:MAG: ester cyclase [Humibacillus sp.]|nr:ester cyclase [Humibacillus sp.]MDN5775538.1 ester cyclase [Humibacillus sp.]